MGCSQTCRGLMRSAFWRIQEGAMTRREGINHRSRPGGYLGASQNAQALDLETEDIGYSQRTRCPLRGCEEIELSDVAGSPSPHPSPRGRGRVNGVNCTW